VSPVEYAGGLLAQISLY